MSTRHFLIFMVAVVPVSFGLAMVAQMFGHKPRSPKPKKTNHAMRNVLMTVGVMWLAKHIFTMDKSKSKG